MIGTATLSCLAIHTAADVVIFENDNPAFRVGYASAFFPSIYQRLDITMDAWNQPPVFREPTPSMPGEFSFSYAPAGTSGGSSYKSVGGFQTLDIALGSPVPTRIFSHGTWVNVTYLNVPMNAPAGYVVDATTNFVPQGLDIYVSNADLPNGSLVSDTLITMPISLTIDGQPHYGFIEIEKLISDDSFSWNAVRWGYETTPDTAFTIPSSCHADLNNDGQLNIFDISSFLSAFGIGDLSVDFTGDGKLNFFDVSEFLILYSAGCP
ncbi:MAG: EF-hand domain-containing protein [Phycisphaerales bacterium]|nr:EF-hand domain-containing protein [Phycisphaerales bacterium]